MTQALVLGAGGHAAFAWQVGLIAGMAEVGVDVRNAQLTVGTSAGARVAVQLTSVSDLEDQFGRLLQPSRERMPDVNWQEWYGKLLRAKASGSRSEILRRIGSLALAGGVEDDADRRSLVASQIGTATWPDRQLRIVAVEAETGERRIFDRASGIDLLDAVMASIAVAGMRPAVPFRGLHYFDGGFYSTDNADVAEGYDRVLVLALRSGTPSMALVPLDAAVQALESSGSRVEVIQPDDATQAVFAAFGNNLLDPALRERTAQSAREQGRRIARERIAGFWSCPSVPRSKGPMQSAVCRSK